MNYIAIFMPDSNEIYGVAAYSTIEEVERVADFAEAYGLRCIIGTLYAPDALIMHAKSSFPLRRPKDYPDS